MLVVAFALAGCSRPDPGSPAPMPAAAPIVADERLRPRVTVSGVSSGGYMAVQAHVALGERIGGVGVIAGGPYRCAEGSVTTALGRCMSGEGLDIAALTALARDAAAAGRIAPLDALSRSRIWIFHSPSDAVVARSVSAGLVGFYADVAADNRLRLVDDVETAHGWPTLATGAACLETGGDYINACGYDAAGEMLAHLYGELAPRASPDPSGSLSGIDLSEYFPSGSGVAAGGYLYVPAACSADADDCRLHIVFHGCRQGAEFVEDRFVRQAGLNDWAADNRIVIVYPQIESSLFNPQGCWDWWGYTGADYDTRDGKQLAGVAGIITAFAVSDLY